MIDDQLTFSEHIAKSARSCRFALFNIKKIRPFLSENASQLAGLLQCSLGRSIKPLQLIQSAAARFIFKNNACYTSVFALRMARYHNFGFGTIPECNTLVSIQ